MSTSIVGGCPLGGRSRSLVTWTFQPTDSATGGYLDISVWRRVNGHDCLLCSRRIKHYSTKRRRDMRRAALGAAVVELRRLSRWAGERVAAIEAGEGDQG